MSKIFVLLLALVAMVACVSGMAPLLVTDHADKSVPSIADNSLPLIEGAWYGGWNPAKIEGNTTTAPAFYGGWNPEKIEGSGNSSPAYYGAWDPMKIEGSRDY